MSACDGVRPVVVESKEVPFWSKFIFFTPFLYPIEMVFRSGQLSGRVRQIVYEMKRDKGENIDRYVEKYKEVKKTINSVWFHGLVSTAAKVLVYILLGALFPVSSMGLLSVSIKTWGIIDLSLHSTAVSFAFVNRIRLPVIRAVLA